MRDVQIGTDGNRVPIPSHKDPVDFGTTPLTTYLVVGRVPDPDQAESDVERDSPRKFLATRDELRAAAESHRVPVISVAEFETYTKQRLANGYGHRTDWIDDANLIKPSECLTTGVGLKPVPQTSADEGATTVIVRGRVVDENEQPVSNANVVAQDLSETAYAATSDAKGEFQFAVPVRTKRLALEIRDAADSKHWAGSVYFSTSNDQKRPGIDEPLVTKLSPLMESLVRVVDEHGVPVVGANVVVQSRLSEVGMLTTDEDGLVLARLAGNDAPPMVIAYKSGKGYDYFSADVRDTNNYLVKNPPRLPEKLTLVLNGAQTIRVKAVDSKGQPVSGVAIYPWYVNKEGNSGKTNFGSQAFRQITDNDGLVVFDWIPPSFRQAVTFWARSDDYDADRLSVKQTDLAESSDYEVKLRQRTVLAGRVTDQTGNPVGGAMVLANGTGMSFDPGHGRATTDDEGRFSMKVAPEKAYVAHVTHGTMVGYKAPIVIREGKAVTSVEIELQEATAVRGKVTRGTPAKPVADEWVSLRLDLGRVPDEIEQLRPRNGPDFWKAVEHQTSARTDENGLFLFFAAPGDYILSGPRQAEAEKFTITNQQHIHRTFHLPRPGLQQFRGVVRDGAGETIKNATVYGVYATFNASRHHFVDKTDADGRFDIERETQPARVHIHSGDKSLATVLEIDGETEERDVVLKPTSQVTGRLVDQTGDPIVGGTVDYDTRVYLGGKDNPWWSTFGGKATTDKDGRYPLKHLAQ